MTAAQPIRPIARDTLLVLLFWLVACALMTALSMGSLRELKFPDPDDSMRLLQVRDWIAGQSWFDVTQYRLNVPQGVHMHWSRLVDVPIAAVVLLFRPLLGQPSAESVALVTVPLLTLGIVMLLVHRIAIQMLTGRAALVAVAVTPVSLGALKQLRPMRIDHHGWQIVLALTAVLAAMDERQRRSGAIAGIAMALWLNISIEGLPFAAAVGALFALRWLVSPSEAERLKAYMAALAGGSIAVFGLTHLPSTWLTQPRDVVTVAHLAAFTVAFAGCAVAFRPTGASFTKRAIILGVIGVATVATMFGVDPHWTQGPWATLDPLVREFWYNRIDEGLPVWRVDRSQAAVGLAQPIVGLIGAILGLHRSASPQKKCWTTYLILLAGCTLAGICVLRSLTTASIIALPGTALLCQLAYRRAQKLSLMPVRATATAGALCIMTPAYALPLTASSSNQRVDTALTQAEHCTRRTEVEKLRALPTSEIAAPLEITPAILISTSHRAIASGHHRNIVGMRDVMRMFMMKPAVGAKISAARHIDYVVMCLGAPESIRYANRGPGGLSFLLRAGAPPEWLEPVQVPGLRALKVWRVRKDLLAAGA